MHAVRWHGRGDVRVDEIPEPGPPQQGWVTLRVDVCGICGTDVEEYRRGPIVIPTTSDALSGACAPVTMGHEPIGVVEAVGADVAVAIGTRVAVETNVYCGHCFWCRRHEYQLCASLSTLGLHADGALAELMLAPAYMCVPFDGSVSNEEMALAEPLAVAMRVLRRGGISEGTTVGIVGMGTIGLLTLQAARIAGARVILGVESYVERHKLALDFGADEVVTPTEGRQSSLDLTGGVGLDVTIEAAGNRKGAVLAIAMVRRGGRVVLAGVYDDIVEFNSMDLLLGEKEIVASLSHVIHEDFVPAVRLLEAGEIGVRPLISDRLALSEVVTHGLEALIDDPAHHLKVLIVPNQRPRA